MKPQSGLVLFVFLSVPHMVSYFSPSHTQPALFCSFSKRFLLQCGVQWVRWHSGSLQNKRRLALKHSQTDDSYKQKIGTVLRHWGSAGVAKAWKMLLPQNLPSLLTRKEWTLTSQSHLLPQASLGLHLVVVHTYNPINSRGQSKIIVLGQPGLHRKPCLNK